MSLSRLKRHNHRVHPCENARKQELLKELSELYKDKSILVISEANTTTTHLETKNLTLSNDHELSTMENTSWEVLISFELPKDPQNYLKRLDYTTEMALVLFDDKEQTRLYNIEKLLGKNIKQEIIKGFEPKTAQTKDIKKTHPTKSQQRSAKEDDKKRKNLVDKEKSFSAKKEWDKKPAKAAHHHDKKSNPSKRTPRKIQISKEQQNKKA